MCIHCASQFNFSRYMYMEILQTNLGADQRCQVSYKSMQVMKPTLCTIYLQFIPSLYLYVFRAC
jgi:hypothetical protein